MQRIKNDSATGHNRPFPIKHRIRYRQLRSLIDYSADFMLIRPTPADVLCGVLGRGMPTKY